MGKSPEFFEDYNNLMLRTAQLSKGPSFSQPLASLWVEARARGHSQVTWDQI